MQNTKKLNETHGNLNLQTCILLTWGEKRKIKKRTRKKQETPSKPIGKHVIQTGVLLTWGEQKIFKRQRKKQGTPFEN